MLWLLGSSLETKLYPDCVVMKIIRLEQNVEGRYDFCEAHVEVGGIDPFKPTSIKFVSTLSTCYQQQDLHGFGSVFMPTVSTNYLILCKRLCEMQCKCIYS